ncbi:glycosyltransferase 87 family protein [Actinocrinis sp.]|uniref:glycosyltransferase 87 family protein n=1 Tax=Actinocrinis sp. TaxID=1920516 RepID=UPI002D644E74|nr:glycosyltransferase 87 family protein [Actinocrinis sp.]HZP50921.1 glycosyltransferase 87 family protein [Actinocrinis sp.]
MGARSVAVLRESRQEEQQPVGQSQGKGRGRTVALCALVLLVFAVSLITVSKGKLNFDVYRVDLNVYRLGGRAWLDNKDLYGQLPLTRNGLNLGFTYPPISAIVMSPLAMVPARVAGILITAITLGLLLSVIALFLRTAGIAAAGRSWRLAALLLPVAALFEPLRTNLAYGQINVILMALVAFDCLSPATWWRAAGKPVGWPRGALVGLAAALKLTPAIFVLYFVARRQWRAAITSIASFFVVTGLGVLCAPQDSHEYWTKMVFDTGRIGPLVFAGNQSLNGFLYRTHLTGNAEHDVWLVVATMVGIVGVVAVFRAARANRQLLALSLTACTTLLLSPVSWSHHWVWAAPIVLTGLLAAYRARNRAALALFGGGLILFLSSPQWWFPGTENREMHWAWWEQAIGSAYVWAALGALIAVAVGYAPSLLPADPQ